LINMSEQPERRRYLSAAEAAAKLGVSTASLYAYVSRGHLRSEPDPKSPRASRYLASEVERLVQRKRARARPELAALEALDWGSPVLESRLTLIDGGRFYYRGVDALALAREARFEDVVRLLWEWESERAAPAATPTAPFLDALERLRDLPPVERLQALLPVAAAGDPGAFDTRPDAVAATGWRIVDLMTRVATGEVDSTGAVAERLARGWSVRARAARRLIDTALIACADHELNVSAFAVRVVASTRSTPYDAVLAGLAALRGPRHGGHTARVEALLDEAGSPEALPRTVSERTQRGEPVPGFGHPLYPAGDPRGELLFRAVEAGWPASPAAGFVEAAREAGRSLLGEHPTLDFGLVAVRRALGLPRGSALVLFALGRTAGWIAHAREQYALDALIRPRADYRGPRPDID
jgi:citrate synthase